MPILTAERLHDLLLPLLETTATATGTQTWQAQTDAASPHATEQAPHSSLLTENHLSAAIAFSGALTGCLVLTADRGSAHLLLGSAPDLDQAWLSFASSVADRLCPAVSAITGLTTLRDCRIADPAHNVHPLLAPITLRSFDEHTALSIAIAADDTLLSHLRPAPSHVEDRHTPAIAPLHRVIDVPLAVTLRFGQRHLTLREVLDLNTGSLLELDRQVEEPVDLVLGNRIIARGEVMIIDGNYGMRVTEVLETSTTRASALRNGNA